ncbi:MAG: hypothetical protein HY335_05950, partial [Deinococcus sp.]|nr:hypothetical protein [Deinococcus sp.]
MGRFLLLSPGLRLTSAADLQPGRTVLTPSPRAARALGAPPHTLEDQARQTLSARGLGVAPPLLAQRQLEAALREVLEITDPAGTARAWAPTLRELLWTGVSAEALKKSHLSRAREQGVVLEAYQGRLQELGLVDQAAVLWEAVRLNPRRQALL